MKEETKTLGDKRAVSDKLPQGQKCAWTYSRYRATLRLNDKPFALVTPDGMGALTEEAEGVLLNALNGNSVPSASKTS